MRSKKNSLQLWLFASALFLANSRDGSRKLAGIGEEDRIVQQLARGRDVEYSAAFALALSSESSASQRLAADLAKRFAEDTAVQFEYLPTLRALATLAHREPLSALEHLEPARPYDLALPGTAFFAKFGSLYPAYIRGLAYLRTGRGREAAVEFDKVLNHRGLVFADPIGALAHLQLGRAYAVAGDTAKAAQAYQDFLMLWKDADPDIPVLKQAKAEYAKLQQGPKLR